VIKVLAAFASIVGVGMIAYTLSLMPAPREQDRITSPNGELSIIRPRDWIAKPVYAPEGAAHNIVIVCEPPKSVGVGPRLLAGRFKQPPNIDQFKATGFQPGKFQDQDALILSTKTKRDFLWRAVFQRGGHWYEVLLRLDGPVEVQDSGWWPYLTSFRAAG
jgi:hypothetical protein